MNKLDLTNDNNRILPKLLTLQAKQTGHSQFLITDERRLTFAEVDQLTNALAAGLSELGVGEGDRVAFYLECGLEAVLTALATNKIKAIWVPINADYKGDWLSDTIARSRCKVLVTEKALQDRIADIAPLLRNQKLVVVGPEQEITLTNAVAFDRLCEYSPIEPNYDNMHHGDTCAILWTSGTTGKSKGVLQSHNSWLRPIAEAASPLFDSREGDVIYNVLPLFNSGAWITAIFRALYEGLPVVLEKRFSVSNFWERVKYFGATQTFTLGAMHMFLWNAPERADDSDNPLRIAQMIPMPDQLKEPFSNRFGVELVPMGYGQSEVMVICSPVNHTDTVPFSSLGKPLDDMEIKLLDDHNNEVPEGEVGEMCLRPLKPHIIFNGYFDDPKANEKAFSGEWYHTGDLGKLDASGAYWFVDRKNDALRYAGRNISSMQVEMVLRKHPDVKDVAAFGIPSKDVPGESELKLDIILKPNSTLTHEAMASYINDNAPYYFVPQYMEFVDSLPYTPTNKIQKFKLREKGLNANAWSLKHSGFQVRR